MRHLPDLIGHRERIAEALTDEFSMASFNVNVYRTSYRADLAALCEVVRGRLFVVGGIRGFGVTEAQREVADILVVSWQKRLRAG